MSTTAESLLPTLLSLPEEDRLEIAERLQESVYEHEEAPDISDEMKATLDRRWEEIESGKVTCIPHEQVMEKLHAKYGI